MGEETATARERVARDLAEAILPHVRRVLARSTHELTELEERLALGPDAWRDEGLLSAAEDRDQLGHSVGWCLGVLAAGSGTDLLIARREEAGLRLLVGFVQEALGGRELDPPVGELPILAAERGDGWELPFLLGWLFLRVGLVTDPKQPVRWGLLQHGEEQSFLVECEGGVDREVFRDLLRLVPDATLVEEDDCLGLCLPAGYFARLER